MSHFLKKKLLNKVFVIFFKGGKLNEWMKGMIEKIKEDEKLVTLTSMEIKQRIWTHDNFPLLSFLVSYSHHRNFANLLQTPIWPLHKCLDRKRYCLHKQKSINSRENERKNKCVHVWKRIHTHTHTHTQINT